MPIYPASTYNTTCEQKTAVCLKKGKRAADKLRRLIWLEMKHPIVENLGRHLAGLVASENMARSVT